MDNNEKRQIRLWGTEAQKRMRETRVQQLGKQSGVGYEIAKNQCLSGLGNITQISDEITEINDIKLNFSLSEEVLDLPQCDVLSDKLREQNSNVNVVGKKYNVDTLLKDEKNIEIRKHDYVIGICLPQHTTIHLNDICASSSNAFIKEKTEEKSDDDDITTKIPITTHFYSISIHNEIFLIYYSSKLFEYNNIVQYIPEIKYEKKRQRKYQKEEQESKVIECKVSTKTLSMILFPPNKTPQYNNTLNIDIIDCKYIFIIVDHIQFSTISTIKDKYTLLKKQRKNILQKIAVCTLAICILLVHTSAIIRCDGGICRNTSVTVQCGDISQNDKELQLNEVQDIQKIYSGIFTSVYGITVCDTLEEQRKENKMVSYHSSIVGGIVGQEILKNLSRYHRPLINMFVGTSTKCTTIDTEDPSSWQPISHSN